MIYFKVFPWRIASLSMNGWLSGEKSAGERRWKCSASGGVLRGAR